MANELIVKRAQSKPRRLLDDMPFRQDLLLNNEVFTSIVSIENPGSILNLLGVGFGDTVGLSENSRKSDPTIELKQVGIGANYIKIKQYSKVKEPLVVTDASAVPEVINANQIVRVTMKGPVQDQDEFVHMRDQKTMARVYSSRNTDGGVEYELQFSGLPNEKFSGALLNAGSFVNYGFGNSKGESSQTGNLMSSDAHRFDTFFQPMSIMRYKKPQTGDAASSDATYTATVAMDGSSDVEINTGLNKTFFRNYLEYTENLLWHSRANYNPETYEILGRNNNSSYTERAAFAGVFQQLDQAQFVFKHRLKDNLAKAQTKLDRIMQQLRYAPGNVAKTIWVIASGVGAEWIRQVMKYVALNSIVKYNREIGADDAIVAGFHVTKYVDDYGTSLYLYDTGLSNINSNFSYDTTTYNGITSTPRGLDLFFFPGTYSDGAGNILKPGKLYTKSGQGDGVGSKVNRGFVFGRLQGFTGENTGFANIAMQQQALEDMVNNVRYNMTSAVDANEIHGMSQFVPYFDPRWVCKLSLY